MHSECKTHIWKNPIKVSKCDHSNSSSINKSLRRSFIQCLSTGQGWVKSEFPLKSAATEYHRSEWQNNICSKARLFWVYTSLHFQTKPPPAVEEPNIWTFASHSKITLVNTQKVIQGITPVILEPEISGGGQARSHAKAENTGIPNHTKAVQEFEMKSPRSNRKFLWVQVNYPCGSWSPKSPQLWKYA